MTDQDPLPAAGLLSSPASPLDEWTAMEGSLTIRFLQYINVKRAERWHGLNSWSALEWAGAMAGEAGEACNAAKKLKRIEGDIANINLEEGRSLTDVQNASAKIVDEIADTVIYGVLLASRVGMDLEEAIRMKFNRKSEEYGFPERIPANEPKAAEGVLSSPASQVKAVPDSREWWQEVAQGLSVKAFDLERERDEARLAHQCSEAVLSMAVSRLGGLVEGQPTQRINFLQRIDALVVVEGAASTAPPAGEEKGSR
jgi:NTP pyrophosphatase (non-canonical NTP hydrolase)